jgi:L-alanine-DL-glutamate epimerase-like enolase superfamily enzyme
MKLELRRVRLTPDGVRDARRVWTERESLLLRCSDADGAFGIGEASPLPGYSRDDLAQAEIALSGLQPAAVAAALEQRPLVRALSSLAELLPSEVPSARMALETAGLDLLGRRRGVSAPELLGASPGARRKLAALLGPASSATLLGDAERAVGAGFEHLKLKLGEPGRLPDELAAVAALRARLGSSVGLRLDANGALAAGELEQAWQALESLDIELFEEPGRVPERLHGALPLALDESLQGLTTAAAVELLERRRARCLVLKPMALGGLAHCLCLAEAARQAGSSVVVSHCFDGPFAWRAAAALSLALPEGRAHGLAPHAALSAWQPAPLPVQGGVLTGWSEPGLGSPARHGFT